MQQIDFGGRGHHEPGGRWLLCTWSRRAETDEDVMLADEESRYGQGNKMNDAESMPRQERR